MQLLLDLAALAIGFVMVGALRFDGSYLILGLTPLLALLPLFAIIGFYSGAYSYDGVASYLGMRRALTSLALAVAFNVLAVYAVKEGDSVSRTVLFMGAGAAAILLMIERGAMRWVVKHKLSQRLMRRILLIDGESVIAPPDFEVIDIAKYGVTPDLNDPHALHKISSLLFGADHIVVSSVPERRENWSFYLKGLGCSGELLLPELHTIGPLYASRGKALAGIPVSTGPLNLRNRVMKRSFDLALTVPAILLLTPILIIIAIAVKLSSPGPVLFRQVRMGRSNRMFHVYKFRSMRMESSDHSGARSASRDDNRITAVGRIIRRTSVDELPQLFNILEGDMSLVGPRPHALGSLAGEELFWHIDRRYWLRHSIKPGITGLAQVRGFRGATDHREDLMHRLQADLEYVSTWSMLNDIMIMIRTVAVMVHKKAY